MSILVVEDEELINKMLQMALRPIGLEVQFARNVPEAFAVLEDHLPDVIIMDIHLPGSKGWDLLDTLRANPETEEIPVIILTAHIQLDNQQTALLKGVSEFLSKPVLPEVLRDAVIKVLNH